MPSPPVSPIVFILPQGLTVTGVNTWALTAAPAARALGLTAEIIAHGALPGFAELPLPAGARVTRLDLPTDRAVASDADVAAWASAYRRIIEPLARRAGAPAALIPTRHDACFAAVASLARDAPSLVRPVLWQQALTRYEDALADHFEPMAAALVAVTPAIARTLTARHPSRAADTRVIPNAVPIPPQPPTRTPLNNRPLRLLYTGRLDLEHKRVDALPHFARAIAERNLPFTLRVAGDGPAREHLERAAHDNPAITLLGPLTPGAVRAELQRADALVLPSRAEGLSFSVLEAMAAACPPIVTRTASGAEDAIEHAKTGWIADAPDAPEPAGRALARALVEAREHGLPALGAAARRRAIEHFSIEAHARALAHLAARLPNTPDRPWPANRPLLARAARSTDADAAQRARDILTAAPQRRFVVHGAGAHTQRLAPALRAAAARILAVTDDDPARWNTPCLDWTVVEPGSAASLGATDVLISSDLHETDIWNRRNTYESQGLRVHRLYAESDESADPAAASNP